MARNLTPMGKLSRREGVELHPKAAKVMAKRPYGPGQHGQGRRQKPSDYSLQLREKQKVKRMYGILERQFRRYVSEAERLEGVSGVNLLALLERRLDNVIYRLGLAPSRPAARQLVTHAHITLNGKKVDIPSILVSPKDKIGVALSAQTNAYFTAVAEGLNANTVSSSWLTLDPKKMTATVTGEPLREELDAEVDEQLIIEYYSR